MRKYRACILPVVDEKTMEVVMDGEKTMVQISIFQADEPVPQAVVDQIIHSNYGHTQSLATHDAQAWYRNNAQEYNILLNK